MNNQNRLSSITTLSRTLTPLIKTLITQLRSIERMRGEISDANGGRVTAHIRSLGQLAIDLRASLAQPIRAALVECFDLPERHEIAVASFTLAKEGVPPASATDAMKYVEERAGDPVFAQTLLETMEVIASKK